MSHGIILFDGVCNFCNWSVNVIIDHDPEGYFQFAALQSESGKALLAQYGLMSNDLDTLILIEEGQAYTHSNATLRILKGMKGWYSLLYDFIVIPLPIRDFFYDLFARYRYNLFGKRTECRIPTKEERQRFM
ncbi:MAG: thiol-disulfide oxidoreductase DCC family protein [Candidatus Kapaibacterium sp.]